MRKNYFVKLVRYMKNVYHLERGLNKLSDGRVNPTSSWLYLQSINKNILKMI